MFPVVWCRGCRGDIQLPITLINREPGQCVQGASVEPALPSHSDKPSINDIFPCFEELFAGLPTRFLITLKGAQRSPLFRPLY